MASFSPDSFKPLLARLVETPEYFSADDLTLALNHIFTPDAVSPTQIGSFLTALHLHRVERRPESLAAAAAVLRERALKAFVEEAEGDFIVDIVGTGGDGYNLFNVSTTAAIVAAGAGARVIKHGSRASTSSSGSADLLQALGCVFTAPAPGTTTPIPRIPFTFILAPNYHPTLASIAPYRKTLPFRTMFNILGPLINPARPQGMVLGIAVPEIGPTFAQSLKEGGVTRAVVVCGHEKLDEISCAGPTYAWELRDDTITETTLTPESFGLPVHPLSAVAGGSPIENAETFKTLLTSGKDTPSTLIPVRDFVLMNASALLVVAGIAADYRGGARLALESINSGKAWKYSTSMLWTTAIFSIFNHWVNSPAQPTSPCPQVPALFPIRHAALLNSLEHIYREESFKRDVYDRLGGVISVPTESFDDMLPVGHDSRWTIFQTLHNYLEGAFPAIYSSLNVTRVNTYGLVFHWQGTEHNLKPILLAAHQDVVPVDPATHNHWKYPPYSGYFDGISYQLSLLFQLTSLGIWIWGRGSADDKSDLVAQLVTIETLLKSSFAPRRSIVLAFGFDEESKGTQGAGKIAEYLEKTYGHHGFAILLDEGDGYGENVADGLIFASPGISEKGYFDVKIEVWAEVDGHDCQDLQSIGVLSQIVVALEEKLHPALFLRTGSAFANVQCAIEHEPNIPSSVKHLARRALTDDGALGDLRDYLLQEDPVYDAMLRTTQAPEMNADVILGVKANALPEVATVIVNHRVDEQSTIADVQTRIVQRLLPIATTFNMSLVAFTPNSIPSQVNQIILSDAFNTALQPSPVTPTASNPAYNLLSGTIKAALTSSRRYNSTGVIVSPTLGLGNTDTRFYWDLTSNIFRYSHYGDADDYFSGLHTVNEAVRGEAVIEQIRFFTMLILNFDESSLL
ncbi:Gly-x carboxypeptidase [Mycena indigotica]|uniref:Anthranilate phosphoribosyltransferase n=1 Tax=Mycena indigotica TaxID=2126181 RepID=A0A8H6T3M3_9AGAR|nr:Gly-x carboxypeptidase [Mycena indigotica]KAF7309742.1 Gly-x carboxypeptidase [Mycena indigotica]